MSIYRLSRFCKDVKVIYTRKWAKIKNTEPRLGIFYSIYYIVTRKNLSAKRIAITVTGISFFAYLP